MKKQKHVKRRKPHHAPKTRRRTLRKPKVVRKPRRLQTVRRMRRSKRVPKRLRRRLRRVASRRVLAHRPRRVRKPAPPLYRARGRALRRWIDLRRWLRQLEERYEDFEAKPSDLPEKRLRWFYLPQKFLWHQKQFPPVNRFTVYVLLELYFVIYDRTSKEHQLWIRRISLGREIPRSQLLTSYEALVRRLGRKAADVMMTREHVRVGLKWGEVLKMLPHEIDKQFSYLEDSQYIEARSFVGWSVYPAPIWGQKFTHE